MSKIGQVTASSPNSVIIQIDDLSTFESSKEGLQVGSYLKIAEGNHNFIIAMIKNIKGDYKVTDSGQEWSFLVECQPLGKLNQDGKFERGSSVLPVPTEPVHEVDEATLKEIFDSNSKYNFTLGKPIISDEFDFKVEAFFNSFAIFLISFCSFKSVTNSPPVSEKVMCESSA